MSYQPGRSLRVALPTLLCAAPFRSVGRRPGVTCIFEAPEECAARLATERCEAGLIRARDFFDHGGYLSLGAGVIVAYPREQLLLSAGEPLSAVREIEVAAGCKLDLDMLRWLLWEQDAVPRRLASLPLLEQGLPPLPPKRALLQMRAPREPGTPAAEEIDLTRLWQETANVPFMVLVWAVRPEAAALARALELESASLRAASEVEVHLVEWAEAHGEDRAPVLDYAREAIHYELPEHVLKLYGREGSVAAPDLRLPARRGTVGSSADSALSRAAGGERISQHDALLLAQEASLADLGLAARQRIGVQPTSFTLSRAMPLSRTMPHARATPISATAAGADVLSSLRTREELEELCSETAAWGVPTIHFQVSLNAGIGLELFEETCRWLIARFPLEPYGIPAPLAQHFLADAPHRMHEVLDRLRKAGIRCLYDAVEADDAQSSRNGSSSLALHRAAHTAGMRSRMRDASAGSERWEERILYMSRIRALQDETHGVLSFCPLGLAGSPAETAADALRLVAIARLFLDNVRDIEAPWSELGPYLAETACAFGASSFGIIPFDAKAAAASLKLPALIAERLKVCGFTALSSSVAGQGARG